MQGHTQKGCFRSGNQIHIFCTLPNLLNFVALLIILINLIANALKSAKNMQGDKKKMQKNLFESPSKKNTLIKQNPVL